MYAPDLPACMSVSRSVCLYRQVCLSECAVVSAFYKSSQLRWPNLAEIIFASSGACAVVYPHPAGPLLPGLSPCPSLPCLVDDPALPNSSITGDLLQEHAAAAAHREQHQQGDGRLAPRILPAHQEGQGELYLYPYLSCWFCCCCCCCVRAVILSPPTLRFWRWCTSDRRCALTQIHRAAPNRLKSSRSIFTMWSTPTWRQRRLQGREVAAVGALYHRGPATFLLSLSHLNELSWSIQGTFI